MNQVKKLLVACTLLLLTQPVFAESIFAPNISKTITGTAAGGHVGLDVNLLAGVTLGTVNQGDPNTINNAWPVLPTDGTNSQSYTSGGLAKVDLESFVTGQALMIDSFPVVLSVDQSAIPVSQNGSWSLLNITGTISLPTGASTETTLSALNGKVANNYGSATGAVRTAAQVGNATGLADFNAGTTSAQTLRVVLPTDQTAIPSSQSGTWNINNVTGTVSLPTGAATVAKQPALGTAGTASTDVISVQGIAAMTPLASSQSGTWNITNVSGTVSLPTGAATVAKQPALGTAGTASSDVITIQGITSMTPLLVNGSGVTQPTSAPVNVTPSFASGSISGVTSVSAPANTVEVMVYALDTNTADLRVAFGATASASNGFQLQPGRSETLHVSANASICPESGTQGYTVQWIAR